MTLFLQHEVNTFTLSPLSCPGWRSINLSGQGSSILQLLHNSGYCITVWINLFLMRKTEQVTAAVLTDTLRTQTWPAATSHLPYSGLLLCLQLHISQSSGFGVYYFVSPHPHPLPFICWGTWVNFPCEGEIGVNTVETAVKSGNAVLMLNIRYWTPVLSDGQSQMTNVGVWGLPNICQRHEEMMMRREEKKWKGMKYLVRTIPSTLPVLTVSLSLFWTEGHGWHLFPVPSPNFDLSFWWWWWWWTRGEEVPPPWPQQSTKTFCLHFLI